MKKLVLIFLFLCFSLGCSVSELNEHKGILHPHISDSNYIYLGNVNNQFVYSDREYETFHEGTNHFYVISVNEEEGYLIRDQKGNRYAIQAYDEIDTVNINFNLSDSFYVNLWQKFESQIWLANYKSKRLKNGESIFPINTNYYGNSAYIYYVLSYVEHYGGNDFLYFVIQKEEKYSVLIDKNNHTYKSIKCDYIWNPLAEEGKSHNIKNMDIADALIKYFEL